MGQEEKKSQIVKLRAFILCQGVEPVGRTSINLELGSDGMFISETVTSPRLFATVQSSALIVR